MSVTTTPVKAYAHCPDPLCDGSNQVEVDAEREVIEKTIGDRGGDGVFVSIVENTWTYLRFADAEQIPCPSCGLDRELSDQPRPGYQRLIGPPDALLRARRAGLSGPSTADAVLAAASEAGSREPTARETLDMRFVNGEIDDTEYFAKRAALGGDGAPAR